MFVRILVLFSKLQHLCQKDAYFRTLSWDEAENVLSEAEFERFLNWRCKYDHEILNIEKHKQLVEKQRKEAEEEEEEENGTGPGPCDIAVDDDDDVDFDVALKNDVARLQDPNIMDSSLSSVSALQKPEGVDEKLVVSPITCNDPFKRTGVCLISKFVVVLFLF